MCENVISWKELLREGHSRVGGGGIPCTDKDFLGKGVKWLQKECIISICGRKKRKRSMSMISLRLLVFIFGSVANETEPVCRGQ